MNFGDPSTHHHIVTFGSEFYRNTQKSRGSRTTISGFVPITFPITEDRQGNPLRPPFTTGVVLATDDEGNLERDDEGNPLPQLRPSTFPITGSRLFFPSAKADTFALYVQDEITIMDRVTLIPAVRWDHWKNETHGRPDRSASTVNPKIGTVIQVTDFLFLTANYAHGFRQPTFGELFISGTHAPGNIFAPNPDLKPERSRNIDAGFRVNLPKLVSGNDQFIFKGTYFRNQFKNFIDFVRLQAQKSPRLLPTDFRRFPRTGGCPDDQEFVIGIGRGGGPLCLDRTMQDGIQSFRNVPDALIHGLEAEFEWRALENVVLSGNYTFTHGNNKTNGQPLNSIPPNRGVLGIDYFYDPWGLNLGARSQMVADQNRVAVCDDPFVCGTNPTPGYVLFDIWATLQPARALLPDLPKSWLQGFRVNLGVDNLTDRNYRRHLATLPEAGVNPKISFWYSLNLP